MYVYLPAETAGEKHKVGFYIPKTSTLDQPFPSEYPGTTPWFVVESEWECREDAARRVHFLNGGGMYDGSVMMEDGDS